MLISIAHAQAAGGGVGAAFDYMTILPLILIFVVFYFLLIRPQQNKLKAHRAMIDAIRRGDTVTTGGGIIDKVVRVLDDATVQVEIADNVRIRVVRSTIAEVRVKGEPAKEEGGDGKPAESAAKSDS